MRLNLGLAIVARLEMSALLLCAPAAFGGQQDKLAAFKDAMAENKQRLSRLFDLVEKAVNQENMMTGDVTCHFRVLLSTLAPDLRSLSSTVDLPDDHRLSLSAERRKMH